jgi:hypothetical protein
LTSPWLHAPPAPRPVSQWDFNEGVGTTAGDGAGANNGTLVGDTAWSTDTPDGSGSSLVFDGGGDYVRVNDHSSLHLTGELTLMAWVKETAVGQYAKSGFPSNRLPLSTFWG